MDRRRFLQALGVTLAAGPGVLVAADSPASTLPVNLSRFQVRWFRAFSDKSSGPIFAEASYRIDCGEWIVKREIKSIEEEDCTRFLLHGEGPDGVELVTAGKWRREVPDDVPNRHFIIDGEWPEPFHTAAAAPANSFGRLP